MARHIWSRPSRAGLLVLATLIAIPIILVGCAGAPPAPTAAPTAAPKPAPTTAPAAPTTAPAAPTAAPAAPTKAPAAPTTAPAAPTAAAPAPTKALAPTTPPAVPTAGQLAGAGSGVFSANCASCHGAQGQGVSAPPLIGQNIRLQTRFNNAQALNSYISSAMPANAPGSLSADQYLQVTAYLLVQNGFAQSSTPLSSAALGGVPLKR